MDKLKHILFWGGGTLLILVVLSFSKQQYKSLRTNGITIEIDHSEELYFVTADDVSQLIYREYPFYDSLYLQEINIPLLEESIDNHPSIRKAEVYSKLDGSLRIDVYQRQPLVRLQYSGTGLYLDEKGDSMPLSPRYAVRVPLINGVQNAEMQQQVYAFFKRLQTDEFFNGFFGALNITAEGEWILYPRLAHHQVLAGVPERMDEKLEKLKKFYQNTGIGQNNDTVKTINLKYKDQVICRKQ